MSKKILSFFLVLSMIASMFTFVSVLAEGETILSYSFESENEGWTYWRKDNNQINSLSEDKAKTGSKSLYVNDTSKEFAGGFQSQYVTAEEGVVYTATIDCYNITAGTTFYLRFYGSDKKNYLLNKSTKAAGKDKWETLKLSVAAPEGTKLVSIVVATNMAGNGTAYFDNAKIVAGKASGTIQPSVQEKPEETTKPQESVNSGDSKYKTEIDFLAKLGLLDSDFKYNEKITKAQMAKVIAKAMHPEMDFSKALDIQAFSDVPTTHLYHAYIKACKDLKIANGDYQNNFYPDNQVTAVEVMTMIINALGYTPYAEAFGGFPTGYYQVASSTGISKGVNLASSETVNGEVVAKIIYNSLFADLIELSSISNGSIEIKVDGSKNLLSARLGIYEYDATVIDNGIGSIEGTTMGDTKKAVIKDTKTGNRITAYVCDTDVSEYLGYRVKAFVKNNVEEGRNEFVYVIPHKSYETLTVNSKDIINKTAGYIEYDEDPDTFDSEKVNYNQNEITIILNGVVVTGYALTEVIPADGFVTFVENDGDNDYDLANIISFNVRGSDIFASARNIIVDDVVTKEGEEAINCIFNPIDSLDLNEDDATYSFAMNDEIKSISSLKQYDIVSIAEAPVKVNGKTHYILVANREVKEGIVDSKGNMTVMLSDGVEYDLSTSLTYVKPSYMNFIQLAKSATVYLDKTGKIAYVKTEGGSSKNYAYIVTTAIRQRAGSQALILKIFTKDGKMLELPVSEKAKIDGKQYNSPAEQQTAVNKRFSDSLLNKISQDNSKGRPVIVDIKDDKITRIDTDTPNHDLLPVDSSDISKHYASQTLIKYSEADAASFDTLNAGYRNPRMTAVFGSYRSINSKFFVTGDTVVLAVPEIDTYGISEKVYNKFTTITGTANVPDHIKLFEQEGDEFYKVMPASAIKAEALFDIQAYDVDPDTGAAGLVVVRGRTDILTDANNSADLYIFDKMTDVYDVKKEKTVKKLYYYDSALKESVAYVDLDTAFYQVKYNVEGMDGTKSEGIIANHNKQYSTTYKNSHIIKKLSAGDIVRIAKDSEGYVTRIERLINIRDYKLNGSTSGSNTLGVGGYNNGTSGSSNIAWMHYANKRAPGYAYLLGMGYPSDMSGSTLKLYASCNNLTLGNINPGSSDTYSEMFIDVGSIQPVVVTFNDSGDVNVKKGNYDDIKFHNFSSGKDIDESSLIVYTAYDGKMKYVYIINGLENIIN